MIATQVDMHYYGTYAIALMAGIPNDDAQILAYASQYVDDSTRDNNNPPHEDGSMLVSFTTAHHMAECAAPNMQEEDYQRKVWMPNHFIPGGVGTTFEEKVLCTKNSKIAQTMFDEHIALAIEKHKQYGLELMGITAHAYMDTFSHYGFSGFASSYNKVENDSIHINSIKDRIENKRIGDKFAGLVHQQTEIIKDTFVGIKSFFANEASGIGHGGVLSFPDQPYLKWNFKFEKNRPGNGVKSVRDNQKDYFEALQNLYCYLRKFATGEYSESTPIEFKQNELKIKDIIALEGDKDKRSDAWLSSGLLPQSAKHYLSQDWENEKNRFNLYEPSSKAIDTPIYHFHQAAAYHRYYVLKDLLPRFGLAVY